MAAHTQRYRAYACPYEILPKYRSYRVSNTETKGHMHEAPIVTLTVQLALTAQ